MTPPVTQLDAVPAARIAVHERSSAAREAGGGRGWAFAKRAFDIGFSTLLVLLLAPLLLVLALAIKLDSRGPVLFRQRRLGRDMQPFTVLKFRTMHPGVSSAAHRAYIAELANGNGNGNGHWNGHQTGNGHRNGNGSGNGNGNGNGLKKLTADARVTRVGRTLRKLSIDELPQLFNVIGGSMSLIGPRPALSYELEHYGPRHYERFLVRPGLSGLWQVSGRNQLGFNEMLDLDAEYAENCGPATDARIFVRTPIAMVRDAA
jgi:lipopolysaccharide/colanic/teichoic acid biosynthesis glycosyltransferase